MNAICIERLFRAHVLPADWRGAERTVYVEAASDRAAVQKIAAAIGAIELRSASDVQERVYNCHSAQECIDHGESADKELRLFEIGRGPNGVCFTDAPVFLTDDPAPLARKWALASVSPQHVHIGRAVAQGLRDAAALCRWDQIALRTRLTQAAATIERLIGEVGAS